MRKIAALTLLLVATSAFADGRRWKTLLDQSLAALQAGDYAKSKNLVQRVTNEMMGTMGPGEAAEKALAITVLHRAVAEAGLGNAGDAEWYWDVANSLDPSLSRSDLEEFGPAGRKLMTPPPPPKSQVRNVKDETAVKAPKVRKRVEPVYPAGARAFGLSGMLIVELVIDDDGRVLSPRILQPLPAPTMSLAALEAVKQWQFEPGTIEGKPVPVIFNLTVGYKLTP